MRLLFILALYMSTAFASVQEMPRHMIIVSMSGPGAIGFYEDFRPDSSSDFKKFDIFKGNVAFNYAYTLTTRLQLGGFLSNQSEERHYETREGKKGRLAYKTLLWGLSSFWNFSDDLYRSYYVGLLISFLNHEEEFSKNRFDYLEDDRNATTYELAFGKRFSLKRWNLKNISYSPSLAIFKSNNAKDYDDDGLSNSWGASVEVVKFDVLF